ncbi:MAG: guanylate kinase [Mycoplasmoidaceae bacterium]
MGKKGLIFIVSGPSGVGKKTILDKIIFKKELNLKYSVSSTTREPRAGETHGIDYFFLSKEQFEDKIKNKELIEWVEFAGNRYGTLKSEVDKYISEGINVVLEIEVQGGQKIFEKLDRKDFVSIFIVPPSIEELERRLINRNTESMEKIKLRLEKTKSELDVAKFYDYVVLNDDSDKAAKKIEKIIKEVNNEK